LIKNTDAVIFLTNASRLLTQGERELINELKTKLNGGDNSKAADNLFIVVNFMDLLRQETDRASVKERIERFAYNNNPIIAGDNRIHFISAQAALDAMLKGYEDKYLNSFNGLTESIETFLTSEIGSIKLNQNVDKVKNVIQSFKQQQKEDRQDILEQIGIVCAWDEELYQLIAFLEEEAINETLDSWNEWIKVILERVTYHSETWVCSSENEQEILRFYCQHFHTYITKELNYWFEQEINGNVLKTKFKLIDEEIESILEALEDLFVEFDNQGQTNIKKQIESSIFKQKISLNIDIGNIDDNDGNGVGFGLGLSGAGLVGLGLFAFTGIGLIPIALTALGSGFGLGALFGESKQDKIKRIVLEKGLEQFYESQQETFDKISEEITLVFENRMKLSSQIIKKAILILENLIERQDNFSKNQQKINNISSKINVLMPKIHNQHISK
jgi:hypothetical protein